MKELLAPFPSSYHTHKTVWSGQEMASMECPQCGTAINDDCHFCTECGGELTVCSSCKSVNVVYARFCHMCGQPTLLSPAPNEIAEMLARKPRDFDILDQAALAIVKLREIIESIERLELAHQIACSRSVSVPGEHYSKVSWR